MWKSGASGYFEAFTQLVEEDPFGVKGSEDWEWSRVHVDKTGTGLAMFLESRGLARDYRGEEYASWFEVERHTADLLMAFLASIVGKDPDVAMDPITDSEGSMAAFTTLPESARAIETELEPIRYALLKDILPGPSDPIDISKLADFKAENRGLLAPFRNEVEQETLRCAQVPDPRLRDKQLELARTRLVEGAREIETQMSKRKFGAVVRGSVGVAAAAFTVADAILSGGSVTLLTGGALGLAGAMDSAFQGTRRKDILSNPLAYAALAGRKFGPAATG